MKKIVILIALVAVAAGGFLGWTYMNHPKDKVDQTTERPLFFKMNRFAISVEKDNHSRYLVMEMSLKTHSPEALLQFKEAEPLLNNILVEHFSGVTHQEAKETLASIEPLQKLLLERFNACLAENKFQHKIEQVLLTNLFLQ